MAEEEKPEENEEVLAEAESDDRPEEKVDSASDAKQKDSTESAISDWIPKTTIGKLVKSGHITSINEILDKGYKILEPEIVDMLVDGLETELLLVGQSKGKFGGGQRRVFKQTQKKTSEGNRPQFTSVVVVGNRNGYVGIGIGKSKETVPAREKAIRRAKLNIMKIRRGSGSWEDSSSEPHSIPFAISGKCGSIRLRLLPAPRGTGLCAHKEIQKILRLAGISNIWSKTKGHKKTTTNLIRACDMALRQLMEMKYDSMKVVEGSYDQNLAEEFSAAQ